MNDLHDLVVIIEDILRHEYDRKYRVKTRHANIQSTGERSYIINLYPIANGRELLANHIYDIGFGPDVIGISYLKASHFSRHDEVAHLYYADPKTTPELIIKILNENMEEERQNAISKNKDSE